jgi:hypothetical protein
MTQIPSAVPANPAVAQFWSAWLLSAAQVAVGMNRKQPAAARHTPTPPMAVEAISGS